MTGFALARRKMVDGQVRTADVTDLRIITAMQNVPREEFLAPARANLAYLDLDVPVGEGGRRLIKPMVLAKLIQAIDVGPADRVLDVGCATGYGAAILSQLAGAILALEEDQWLVEKARAQLSGYPNASVVGGALAAGWREGAPYDAIIIEGATEFAPDDLLGQLKEGGRLACVLGGGPDAKAMLYRRSGQQTGGRALFDVTAPVLPGFARRAEFSF